MTKKVKTPGNGYVIRVYRGNDTTAYFYRATLKDARDSARDITKNDPASCVAILGMVEVHYGKGC